MHLAGGPACDDAVDTGKPHGSFKVMDTAKPVTTGVDLLLLDASDRPAASLLIQRGQAIVEPA